MCTLVISYIEVAVESDGSHIVMELRSWNPRAREVVALAKKLNARLGPTSVSVRTSNAFIYVLIRVVI